MKKIILLISILVLLLFFCGFSWVIRITSQNRDRSVYLDTLIRPYSTFPLYKIWDVKLGQAPQDYPDYQSELVFLPATTFFINHWFGIDANTGHIVWQQRGLRRNFLRCLTSEYFVVSIRDNLS